MVEIVNNSSIKVSDYWGTGFKRPTLDNITNVVLLGWDSDFSTYLTVKYARPLNTNDPQDNPIETTTDYTWALAWNDTP